MADQPPFHRHQIQSPFPLLPVSQLPVEIAVSLDGIPRQAELHTIIPSRPRIDVTVYTVQTGDLIFKIADNFGLKPTTILFGNYNILKDSPDLLKAGQKLNILPVDGTYYQWQGTESLTKVAEVFGVDPESIINYPGNHLDPDTIGDLNHPNITCRHMADRARGNTGIYVMDGTCATCAR